MTNNKLTEILNNWWGIELRKEANGEPFWEIGLQNKELNVKGIVRRDPSNPEKWEGQIYAHDRVVRESARNESVEIVICSTMSEVAAENKSQLIYSGGLSKPKEALT